MHCVMAFAATVESIKDHCAKVGMALPDREYVGGPDYYVCWLFANVRMRFSLAAPTTWCILYSAPYNTQCCTKDFTDAEAAFARLRQIYTESVRNGGCVSMFFHI
jgi:hypothetical protein